jgi:hypothetical protein
MSMKNFNDTIWNRSSDLPICSTVLSAVLIPKVPQRNKSEMLTVMIPREHFFYINDCRLFALNDNCRILFLNVFKAKLVLIKPQSGKFSVSFLGQNMVFHW